MKDSERLSKNASFYYNNSQTQATEIDSLNTLVNAETLKEIRIQNLLGILNNPWVAQRMGEELQESIIETLKAAAVVYNDELRQDPEIKQAIEYNNRFNVNQFK